MAWVAGCSHRWIIVSVLLALVGAAAPAVAETRVALVIGNGAYKHLTRLPNPAGDAELMAATLKSLGFKLIGDGPQTDVDKPTFERLIRRFGQELTGESVGIFYYAGHGLQVQGVEFSGTGRCQSRQRHRHRFRIDRCGACAKADGRDGLAPEHRDPRRLPQ